MECSARLKQLQERIDDCLEFMLEDDDVPYRTLLQAMLPVLQQHLGKDTGGRRYFVVTLDEDEAPVVEEKEVTAN